MLQSFGPVTGHRARRLGKLAILLIALITWMSPMLLSNCVAKDPIMPSLFTDNVAFLRSQACSFTSFRSSLHRGRLPRNVYLGDGTCQLLPNVCNRGNRVMSYLVLLVYFVCHATHSSCSLASDLFYYFIIYFLGFIYCPSASVAMKLIFSSVCSFINTRINDFKSKFKVWSDGRCAKPSTNTRISAISCTAKSRRQNGDFWLMSLVLLSYGSSIFICGRSWHRT